jgi:hypothetical protein
MTRQWLSPKLQRKVPRDRKWDLPEEPAAEHLHQTSPRPKAPGRLWVVAR